MVFWAGNVRVNVLAAITAWAVALAIFWESSSSKSMRLLGFMCGKKKKKKEGGREGRKDDIVPVEWIGCALEEREKWISRCKRVNSSILQNLNLFAVLFIYFLIKIDNFITYHQCSKNFHL